jgi:hypothetical protein
MSARVSCLGELPRTSLDIMQETLQTFDRRITGIALALSVETLHESTETSSLVDLVISLQEEIRDALRECNQ